MQYMTPGMLKRNLRVCRGLVHILSSASYIYKNIANALSLTILNYFSAMQMES